MEELPSAAVVICAAGTSSRMQTEGSPQIKKEYRKLYASEESPTVLGAAVAAFREVPSVEIIVIAIPKDTEETAKAVLPPEFLTASKPKIFFVNGGETRRASVFNALSFLAQYSPSYVLIHDGARPWVSPSLIIEIIKAAQKYGAVIPILALSDTPKECNMPLPERQSNNEPEGVFIKTHLKRANTGAAQTPQGFKFPEILYAHEKAAKVKNEEFTDDAEVWGRFYGDVAVIPGSSENRKITFTHDIG